MRFSSAFDTRVGFRRLRFRLLLFLVRMWLLFAFIRRSFPLAVRFKRLAAARFVFIFGMVCSFGHRRHGAFTPSGVTRSAGSICIGADDPPVLTCSRLSATCLSRSCSEPAS